MAILIDETTRIIVQGITGRIGRFHAEDMIRHGTNVVGGVTPGRGGETVLDRPVFDTVKDAVRETRAEASLVFVPPAGAAHPEETDLLLGWLEQPGVRVVDVDGEWSCPVRGAQRVDPIAAVALDLALPRQEVAVETLATVLPLRGARTA